MVKNSDLIQIDRMNRCGRMPKITFVKVVKKDLLKVEVIGSMILSSLGWQKNNVFGS
jgi:hypothetical protein